MTCDQILPVLNGSPAPSAELLQLLQQQQLDNADMSLLEEQRIDAQIVQLLQLKAGMLAVKLLRQPGVSEDAALQTPFGSLPGLSGLTTMCAPLALDSSFLSPPASIDVSQDWSRLTGTSAMSAAAAVVPPYNPARHSIDLGGLALRMAVSCELNPNNSFTTQTSGVNQAQFVNDMSALQPGDVPALAAALSPAPQSAVHAPFITSGAAAASAAALAAPAGSPQLPAADNTYLQSTRSIPAQLPDTATSSLEVQPPAAFTVMAPQPPPASTRPSNTRHMSLDVCSQRGLYNSPAAVTALSFNSFTTGAMPMPAQAGWPPGSSRNTSPGNESEPRRASVHFPVSPTPSLSRRLPKKSESMLNPSITCTSARNSPTDTWQQKIGKVTDVSGQAVKAPGCRYNAHQAPAHQAPKWAGSQWNPMADVVKNGQQAAKGTGVFIPGGGFAEPFGVDAKAT